MKEELINSYIETAKIFAKLSKANRSKVGCVIVKNNRIISIGMNGTPRGWDNVCEDENNVTKKEVLHAETNAIAKLAMSTESGEGASLFTTLSPCFECSKLIYQSGIKEIFYLDEYRDISGIEFLIKCNIKTEKIYETKS